MAFLLLFLGLTLLFVAGGNKTEQFHELLAEDFLGANGKASVVVWMAAILLIGAVGLARPLRPIADGFLVLIFVVLILANEGFIDKFRQQTGI